jgi:transcriptional regulator with XRE-family HTH domain
MKVDEVSEILTGLGSRLRAARLQRNDTMDVFAERLGVSVGTVRAMERGAPTVQVGIWLNALWILNELDTLKKVLEPRESLLDRFRTQQKERRRRASKRKTLIDARS